MLWLECQQLSLYFFLNEILMGILAGLVQQDERFILCILEADGRKFAKNYYAVLGNCDVGVRSNPVAGKIFPCFLELSSISQKYSQLA